MLRKRETPRPGRGGGARIASPGGRSDLTGSAPRRRSQEEREPLRWITDGQATVGFVFAAGGRFEAVLVDGRSLGKFASALIAAKAISHGAAGDDRHGGRSLRNSYKPRWDRFQKIVDDWERRMKEKDTGLKSETTTGLNNETPRSQM